MSSADEARATVARRRELLEAVMWATQHGDEVIRIVRRSETVDDSLAALAALGFNSTQAQHILDVPFRRLSSANVSALGRAIEELTEVNDDQLVHESGWAHLGSVDWKP